MTGRSLADVFNRLGYMERKGSGFGKILNGYKAQINYTEDKRPTFRSDRYQFTVVMPNLNYCVPQDVPQRVPQGVPQDDLDAKILALIKKDNKISTEKLGMALGVSYKTIRRHIKEWEMSATSVAASAGIGKLIINQKRVSDSEAGNFLRHRRTILAL